MKINTGKGQITVMTLIAIWSISLAVNLPGLAVTPIEGSLRTIFPDATDFKIQLLTVLPNLVIIPFVLLSGKLSESRHKIAVIVSGTILFLVAGVLSIFTSSLNMLIIMSCLLGAGCGLVLPFSTGLVADVFAGKYRVKQMGIVSAIGNISLVAATFAVGFLVTGQLEHTWHRAFFVYLIPLLSLVLLPFLRNIPKGDLSVITEKDIAKENIKSPDDVVDSDGFSTEGQIVRGGFYVGRTIWAILAYFFFIFVNCVPCYYLPDLKWVTSEDASTIISVFYFAMFVVGMTLTPVMKLFRKATFIVAMGLTVGGFAIYIFAGHSIASYITASALCGFGNGIAQPIFYTKATELVDIKSKSTLALAFIQVANYVAISLVPVVIDSLQSIFHVTSSMFPFIFAGIASAVVLVIIIIRRNHFTFGISKNYY